MKYYIFLLAAFVFLVSKIQAQTVTDIDGNVYDTVHIGKQIWTRQNLKVTHYLNGDPIPNVKDSAAWCNLTTGAYCNYDNDTTNGSVYGRLYNWYAVHDSRLIAPRGWHVPDYSDWDSLQVFLGYDLVAGGKLKEMGTGHWMDPNTGATDEYDFRALPGGQRTDSAYSGIFSEITMQGYWWSSSELDTIYPWGVNISYNSEGMTNWAASTRKYGFSVRLINDLPLDIPSIKTNYFNIYPNPAHNRIAIAAAFNSMVNLAIYNRLGELVIFKQLSSNDTAVDISSLGPGFYIIKLSAANWSAQRKLIKQ